MIKRLVTSLALLMAMGGATSNATANNVGIWTDPTRSYLAGSVNGQPLYRHQEWGVVLSPADEQSKLVSATFGLQFRPEIWEPGDGSRTLSLRVFEWSNTTLRPVGLPIFESEAIDADDLSGPADPWGLRRGTVPLNLDLTPGRNYLFQFIGTGFVLFEKGAHSAPLFLNQDRSGWQYFDLGIYSEFNFASAVPEQGPWVMFAFGLLALSLSRRQTS